MPATMVPCRKKCQDRDGNVRKFHGAHGERMHFLRSHSPKKNAWENVQRKPGVPRTQYKGKPTILHIMIDILSRHTDGLSVPELMEKLVNAGCTKQRGLHLRQYISKAVTSNPDKLVRLGREISLSPIANVGAIMVQQPEPEVEVLPEPLTAEEELAAIEAEQSRKRVETILALCQIIQRLVN